MAVDGYLNFDTKINTAGFQKGLHTIGGGLDTLKSKLGGIASLVTKALGTAALIRFGKQAVETAAAVNAANSAMTQTFGALESAARDAMQRVAEESGIVRTRLQSAGTQIFAFAQASGMDAPRALSMMEDALRVAADSAAYYDRSLEDTTESLRSFLKGNFANDAALGVSCTETTRNIAANKLFAKSYRDLSEAQKQLTLLQMVKDANALSGAEGQAAREAQGWENVIGNLKEQWRQLMAAVGQPALHLATAAVQQLTAWLTVLTEAAQSASEAVAELMGWETEQSTSAAKSISAAVDAQNALTEATEQTAKAQADLTGYDELHRLSGSGAVSGAGGGGNVQIAPTVDKKATDKAANKLTKRLKKLLEPIRLAWELDAPALLAQAKDTADQIKGVFRSVGRSLESVWTNGSGLRLMRSILQIAKNLLGVAGDIAGAFRRAWDDSGRGTAYVQSIADKWNALLRIINAVTESFRNAWNSGTGERILGHILNILTGINGITANLRENFASAWEENGTGERIIGGILKTAESLLRTFDGIVSDTKKWSENVDFGPLLTALAALSEALSPLADTVGEGLRDFWNSVLLPLGEWLIEKGLPGAITLVRRGIEDLNTAIQAVKPYLSWFIDELAKPSGNILGGAFEAFTDADYSPSKIFEGLGGEIYDGTFWDTWAAGAKDLFTDTELSKNMEKFGEGVYDFFAGIGDAVSGVEDFLDAGFQAIDDFFMDLGDAFDDAEAGLEDFGGAVYDAVQDVGAWFSGLWGGIRQTFSDVGEWFSGKFEEAYGGITDAFSAVGKWFSQRWDDIKKAMSAAGSWFGEKFRAAYKAVTDAFQRVGGWFSQRWQDIKSAFSAVGTWFGDRFTAGMNAVKNAFSGVRAWFSDRWEDIKGVFSGVGTWFSDKFRSAYDGITGIFSKLSGFFGGIWDGIKGVLNSMLGGIESMLNGIVHAANKVISFLNGFSVSIPDWVPKIGGQSIGFHFDELKDVKLPRLASGTVIPANFGEFAAVLGDNRREPEIVSPVSAMKQAFTEALDGIKGDGQTIVVQLTCDGRKLAEIVRKFDTAGSRLTNGGVR